MTENITNLSDTIVPKSDQTNADDLLAGPMTITVTEVRRGTEDQPVVIHYDGDGGRPFKPCKSVRKVLIFAWGEDGRQWIGRSMTIYNKMDVRFGGMQVGGIRVSHLSHIKADIQLSLTATKGKKESVIIKCLDVTDQLAPIRAQLEAAARDGMAALRKAWGAITEVQRKSIGGKAGCPANLKAIAEAADRAASAPQPADDGASSAVAGINAAVAAMTDPEPGPGEPAPADPEPAPQPEPPATTASAPADSELF